MAELPSPRTGTDDVVTVVCREFVELVTDYLEGTLPEEIQSAIATHLDLCEPCVIYLEQMRSTARALRALPAVPLPQAAQQRLLEVFVSLHGRHDVSEP